LQQHSGGGHSIHVAGRGWPQRNREGRTKNVTVSESTLQADERAGEGVEGAAVKVARCAGREA
jgi:hypothetical protein